MSLAVSRKTTIASAVRTLTVSHPLARLIFHSLRHLQSPLIIVNFRVGGLA